MTWKRRLARVLIAAIILSAVWVTFVTMVAEHKFEPEPVLVMIWLSAFVAILALDPSLLGAIKGIKLGELIEIELRESLAESSAEEFTLPDRADHGILGPKEGSHALVRLLNRVRATPSKPALLTADLRQDDFISKYMLYIYVWFLEHLAPSVVVLFFSSPQDAGPTPANAIRASDILGAVSGRNVLRVLESHGPRLTALACFDDNQKAERDRFDAFLRHGEVPTEEFFDYRRTHLTKAAHFESERLTREEVTDWFGPRLATRKVEASGESLDMKEIARALERGEEFVITVRAGLFRSVVPVSRLSRQMAKGALAAQAKQKRGT